MFPSNLATDNGNDTTPSFCSRFWTLTAPYWSSREKWIALLLLAAIMAMNLGTVYVQVLLNTWIKVFYDALQAVNKVAFLTQLKRFAELAAAYIVQYVYMLYLNQMLQIRWRRWLTQRYLSKWLHNQAYYRMQFLRNTSDNPDQRISEDINSFIDLTMSLSISLLGSLATLISFVAILWGLSGTLSIPLGHAGTLKIPGYMVWAALAYSALGTWLTLRVGNPLVQLNFKQQRFEADFRFSMVRLRENSEPVALYRGEKDEKVNFVDRFTAVVNNYRQIMRRQKKVNWLTSGYNQLAVIFPVLMAAPRFFSGQMHLGGLMQTTAAFASVHGALSYLVNSYITIASWNAVMNRLSGFAGAIEQAEALKDRDDFRELVSADGTFQVRSLNVFLPDEQVLIEDLDLDLQRGGSLLITGPSGVGKSTLIRAMAGIWPFATGTVRLPETAKVMFLPQKPYLPLGTLRQALYYPHKPQDADRRMPEILGLCHLSHLAQDLDHSNNWALALSLGEQQRIAFARVFLQQPDYVFLDEATASLDEEMEGALYRLMRSRLGRTTVISVGHRNTLVAWHEARLTLMGGGKWLRSSGLAPSINGENPVLGNRTSDPV
ncbi:MAG: ABC transporter ATP-binding protein/permease [Desulfomonile tiedjei]|nr:ABC transporter ATP-binding protein/permease [Desulfomonile tiedjei]